jgi:hypothetical protein
MPRFLTVEDFDARFLKVSIFARGNFLPKGMCPELLCIHLDDRHDDPSVDAYVE